MDVLACQGTKLAVACGADKGQHTSRLAILVAGICTVLQRERGAFQLDSTRN